MAGPASGKLSKQTYRLAYLMGKRRGLYGFFNLRREGEQIVRNFM